MDPTTGEWEDPRICPGCELVRTSHGQECPDCEAATRDAIFNRDPADRPWAVATATPERSTP